MLGVLVSRADTASVGIGEAIRERVAVESQSPPAEAVAAYRAECLAIREFEELHLHLDRPAVAFPDPDVLVFASKHAGETGPLLTAHFTGNVGEAEHGGADHDLARAAPNALDRVLTELDARAPGGYDTGIEATHHGPTDVGAPSLFVEVGSGPEQWRDDEATAAVAGAILSLRGVAPDRPAEPRGEGRGQEAQRGDSDDDDRRRHLVGFGGGHYAPRFARILRETDWAVGHVAPTWGLDPLAKADASTRRAVVERCLEQSRAGFALIDGDYPAIESVCADRGVRVVGETWLRETEGVPLALVEQLESELRPVADGLRLGAAARDASVNTAMSVVELPAELLAAARAIDADATRAAVADRALGFVTDQNGTRLTGPVALPPNTAPSAVVEGWIEVLERDYDAVERRTDGTVVARETGFDPDLAREAGVDPGPKFGKLAEGEAVEVDGEVVEPADVRRERERHFDVEVTDPY